MSKETATSKKNHFDGSMVYGVRKFNKITGRNKHIDNSRQLQSSFFVDPKTGLLYKHMAEDRICPICGAKKSNLIFIKDGFHHVKCDCGFIFVDPTAKDKFRDIFFAQKYESWTEVLMSAEQNLIDTKKFKYGLALIENHIRHKGILVDVGAGSGLFLKVARSCGWKVSGVEFNRKSLQNIKKLKIEVFDKPLEDGIYSANSIDVITLWEVLEHINHPNIFLKRVYNILKPGGILFICVPNINALVTRILHEKSRTFAGSSHVNFFSIDTLSALVKKNDFEVLEKDTAISEIGTIKNYLTYNDSYAADAVLNIDLLTPEYLYKNYLGSRIFLLGRKKG